MIAGKTLKISHSPDSDDAFMFYAIKHKKIDTKGFDFEFSADEIAVLNQKALACDKNYDILAVSFHALAYIQDTYTYLNSGASMAGSDYGPRLVSKRDIDITKPCTIAIPGRLTSAYLVLRLYEAISKGAVWDDTLKINLDACEKSRENFRARFCPYNEVFDLIESGEVDAALLIHEAQLKYQELGYRLIVDLGAWWYRETQGLRMPLGTNAIRKDLGEDFISEFDNMLKSSIEWGLHNLDEVLDYSRKFADNKLDDQSALNYINMYVDKSTISLSVGDKLSIRKLLKLVN